MRGDEDTWVEFCVEPKGFWGRLKAAWSALRGKREVFVDCLLTSTGAKALSAAVNPYAGLVGLENWEWEEENMCNELYEKFQHKFASYGTCEYPDGWHDVMMELVSKLSDDCRISQIKEKFGTLRVYCDNSTNEDEALIAYAENVITDICDVCGKGPVTRRPGGWVSYACAEHQNV
jgi:hypothetical protein